MFELPPVQRILLIKPSSLGDIVHALPTLTALRERFPRARIAWLVKRQWAALVERAEGLDEVLAVEPGLSGWLAVIPRLRAARFELAVDLQGLFRSGAIAWLAGCSTRVGFANGREGSPLFYTHRVPVPSPDMHAVDRYLLVATALGAGGTPAASPTGRARFPLRVRPEDQKVVEELLGRWALTQTAPWIAMNVSARWPTKRWPAEYFASVLDSIQESQLGRVVLIGGTEDLLAAEEVKRLAKTTPVNLTGAIPLGALPAFLAAARALVTNDSGPMHVAAAVGTPVVALFGPTSPNRTGPYGQGHRVLVHKVTCSPCFSRTCRNLTPLECLAGVTPETTFVAVRELLVARQKGLVVS